MINLYIMQKVIFIIVFLSSFLGNILAQEYFQLTPNGFLSNDSKDYIIINNNLSLNENIELLTKAIKSTIPLDKDTKINISNNEIQVYAYKLDLFRMKNGPLSELIMDVDYNLNISIKDNKYKISAPIINNIGVHRFMIKRMVIYANPKEHKEKKKNQFIFDYKSKEVKNKEAKKEIEIYFNNLIGSIIKYKIEVW